MLKNTNISIEYCECTYFDKEARKWLVDAWWSENDGLNLEYQGEDSNERGASIAEISEDGETWEFRGNFGEAITEDNANAWILDYIEDCARDIREHYYCGN